MGNHALPENETKGESRMSECNCPSCHKEKHDKVSAIAQKLINETAKEEDTQVLAYAMIAAASALAKQAGCDLAQFLAISARTFSTTDQTEGSVH